MGRPLSNLTVKSHIESLLRKRAPLQSKLTVLGFAVYYLLDAQGVRWVGCTTRPAQRFKEHLGLRVKGTQSWIEELRPQAPSMQVVCVVETQQEGERVEEALRLFQVKRGAQLLNPRYQHGGGLPSFGQLSEGIPAWIGKNVDPLLLRPESPEARKTRRARFRDIVEGAEGMSVFLEK